MNGTCVNHLIYADDTVIMAPSPAGLQTLLDLCSTYGVQHDIIYNAKKTRCMCFRSNRYKDIYVPEIRLNGQTITNVECHKYLGVLINDQLKDDIDIGRETRAIYARGNSLIRKFRACTTDVKVKLFKTFCCNFYSSSLWCHFTKVSMQKLNVAFKRIFRNLLQVRGESVTRVMLNNNCDPFCVILRKLVYSLKLLVLDKDFLTPTTVF